VELPGGNGRGVAVDREATRHRAGSASRTVRADGPLHALRRVGTVLRRVADHHDLDLQGRATAQSERAAYVLVDAAIADAAERAATFVAVAASRADDVLRIRVRDDGLPPRSRLAHVADRVGALGGRTAFGDAAIEAEIPCA
jgi:hypothetical protein